MATRPQVGGNSTPSPTTVAASDSVFTDRAVVIVGILVGFFVVGVAAQWSPELVNGVLVLILVGTVLGNYPKWLPYLSHFGNAVPSSVKR